MCKVSKKRVLYPKNLYGTDIDWFIIFLGVSLAALGSGYCALR
ncbi:MAG: hypothetical protein NZ455_08105 [Bacteroidia bacterium]|nr:hypothetical protein [Bacteroidia bacterium]MDW8346664.1 hypothetical protein [Bacteroidia bacterium]